MYYVNYCTDEDFKSLAAYSIDVTNKIVLCRFGVIYRGNKVLNAQRYGALGAILFDDPERCAPIGSKVYPDGIYLPDDGELLLFFL